MLLAAIGYWGIGLPLGVVLAFPLGLGGSGIWTGLFAGLAVVALLLVEWLLFHRPTRRSLARVLRRPGGAAPSVRGSARP